MVADTARTKRARMIFEERYQVNPRLILGPSPDIETTVSVLGSPSLRV